MIPRTVAGVTVAGLMSRSNVTSSDDTPVFSARASWVVAKWSEKPVSVPTEPEAFETSRVQAPVGVIEPKAASSDCSGRKLPVNGAEAASIEVGAEPSNVVLMKLAPPPPMPEASVAAVPSGAIRVSVRAPSVGKLIVALTVSAVTVPPV